MLSLQCVREDQRCWFPAAPVQWLEFSSPVYEQLYQEHFARAYHNTDFYITIVNFFFGLSWVVRVWRINPWWVALLVMPHLVQRQFLDCCDICDHDAMQVGHRLRFGLYGGAYRSAVRNLHQASLLGQAPALDCDCGPHLLLRRAGAGAGSVILTCNESPGLPKWTDVCNRHVVYSDGMIGAGSVAPDQAFRHHTRLGRSHCKRSGPWHGNHAGLACAQPQAALQPQPCTVAAAVLPVDRDEWPDRGRDAHRVARQAGGKQLTHM